MVAESFLVWWEDANRAKRAFDSTSRLRLGALVAVEVIILEDWIAFVTLFIVVTILALLNEMFIKRGDLNDLLALPARCQHRTFLPVMDINWLFIEVLIVHATEIANFFVNLLSISIVTLIILIIFLLSWLLLSSWLVLLEVLLVFILLLGSLSIYLSRCFCLWCSRSVWNWATFCAFRIDICLNNLSWLRWLELLGCTSTLWVEHRLYLINLGLS